MDIFGLLPDVRYLLEIVYASFESLTACKSHCLDFVMVSDYFVSSQSRICIYGRWLQRKGGGGCGEEGGGGGGAGCQVQNIPDGFEAASEQVFPRALTVTKWPLYALNPRCLRPVYNPGWPLSYSLLTANNASSPEAQSQGQGLSFGVKPQNPAEF